MHRHRSTLTAILLSILSIHAASQTWEPAKRLLGVTTHPSSVTLANGKTLIELLNMPGGVPATATVRVYDIESVLRGWGPLFDLLDISALGSAADIDGNGHTDMLAIRGRRRDYVLIRDVFTDQERNQKLTATNTSRLPVSWLNESELYDVDDDGYKDNVRFSKMSEVALIYGDSAEPFMRSSVAGARPQVPFHTVNILHCGYLSGKLCLLRKTSIDNTGKPDTTLWEIDTLVLEDIRLRRDTIRCHNVLRWVQDVNLSVGYMSVICDSVWHFFEANGSTAARVRLSGIDTHVPHSNFKTADGAFISALNMYGHGRRKGETPVRIHQDRPFLAYWKAEQRPDGYRPHHVDLLRVRDQMTLRSQLLGTMNLQLPYVDQGDISSTYLIPDQDGDGFEDVVVCYQSSMEDRTPTLLTDIYLTKNRSVKTTVHEERTASTTAQRVEGGWLVNMAEHDTQQATSVQAFDLQGRCITLSATASSAGLLIHEALIGTPWPMWAIVGSHLVFLNTQP